MAGIPTLIFLSKMENHEQVKAGIDFQVKDIY